MTFPSNFHFQLQGIEATIRKELIWQGFRDQHQLHCFASAAPTATRR